MSRVLWIMIYVIYNRTYGLALYRYKDTDWAGDVDVKRSTSGGAFYLGYECLAWHKRKKNRVTLSTCCSIGFSVM